MSDSLLDKAGEDRSAELMKKLQEILNDPNIPDEKKKIVKDTVLASGSLKKLGITNEEIRKTQPLMTIEQKNKIKGVIDSAIKAYGEAISFLPLGETCKVLRCKIEDLNYSVQVLQSGILDDSQNSKTDNVGGKSENSGLGESKLNPQKVKDFLETLKPYKFLEFEEEMGDKRKRELFIYYLVSTQAEDLANTESNVFNTLGLSSDKLEELSDIILDSYNSLNSIDRDDIKTFILNNASNEAKNRFTKLIDSIDLNTYKDRYTDYKKFILKSIQKNLENKHIIEMVFAKNYYELSENPEEVEQIRRDLGLEEVA